MVFTFYIDEDFRREQFIEGYELRVLNQRSTHLSELSKEQLTFILSLIPEDNESWEGCNLQDFKLILPRFDEKTKTVITDDQLCWSGRVNPQTEDMSYIIDRWMEAFHVASERAEAEFEKSSAPQAGS